VDAFHPGEIEGRGEGQSKRRMGGEEGREERRGGQGGEEP
jgi:hypothetical protein